MKKNKTILSGLVLLISLTAIQCKEKEKDNAPNSYDVKSMVTNMANNYIVPAYNAYQTETVALNNLISTFSTTPNEINLENCQDQWKATAKAWQDVSVLEFGPAESISLRSQTNLFPVDTTLIKSNIASNTYDLQQPSNFDAKGLQALDYLLFLPNMTQAERVTYYTNTANAKAYLNTISTELKTNATSVYNQWNTTYATSFISNIESNAVGTSVSNVMNALSLHFETHVRKGKVGIPLGVFNVFSGQVMPSHVEGFYSDYSYDLLIAQMNGLSNYINGKSYANGTDGEGLDNYLDFVKAKNNNQDLSISINDKIDLIKTNAAVLSPSLKDGFVSNNAAGQTLYQSMQQLVPLIKVEITATLGVLITYADTDGD